jgi:hypothetical protein
VRRLGSPQRFLSWENGLLVPTAPVFSPDGRFIACGTSEGTVLLAEMTNLVRKVEQLALGW